MSIELMDDLRRLVADADKAGEGWASDVCGKAIAEIARLKSIVEKLQAGNRAESLAAARTCFREGRYAGTITGAAILERWPWLKEE